MKAVVKRCTLLEETYKEKESNRKDKFKSLLTGYVDFLSKLKKINLDDLSNKEYFELLKKLYTITFDDKDYLYAFSRHYGKNYTNFVDINTNMVITRKRQEGYGNSIVWSEENQKVRLHVAITDAKNFDPNKEYTKEEIVNMAKNKDIIIISTKKIDIPKVPENSETYETLPMVDISKNDLDDFIKSNIPLFGSIMRGQITDEQLRSDIIKFIEDLNFQLRSVTIFNQGIYEATNKECKEWWIASDLKNEYDDIENEIRRVK